MFESLSDRLEGVFKNLRGQGKITEANVKESMRDVRMALLEADVNYNCGNRNADRIVFTKNGEVWLTKNHYKSFQKQ